MSYTVLARKYRSTTFDDLVGQDPIAKTLKRAIESNRIAHAFLFCGTRGTGKTSTARILAKCLNCLSDDKPVTKPCGQCTSCLGVARGDDIDVIEIDAASNTGVDNVREIIENSQYRPARSRFKIYIIDEVHMLSKSAFNALLKTLEEPPEHVKFILATTEAEKVLPTILSRCQRYDFRNIPTREIAEHLRTICESEKIKADEAALQLVAKAGAGSMRDALSLLDRLLSVGEKKLTVVLIEQLLGMPRGQAIFDLAQALGEGEIKGVLEQTDALIRGGLSPDTLVVSLADHLRNLLVLRTCGAKSELVDAPGMSLDELSKQSDQFDTIVLSQDIAILEELRRNLRLSNAGRSLLDATLVRLTLAEQFSSISELIGAVDNGGGAAAPKKKVTSSPRDGEPEQAIAATFKALAPVRGGEGLGEGPSGASGGLSSVSRGNSPSPQPSPPSTSERGQSAPSFAAREVDSSVRNNTPAASDTSVDEDDDLPRPGKVWDSSGPSLDELLKKHEQAAGDAPPASAVRPASNVEPVDARSLPQVFERLVGALKQTSPSLPALLQGARLVGLDDNVATLRYPHDQSPMVKLLERNGKKEAVCAALAGLLDRSIGLKLELEAPPHEVAQPEPVAAPMPAAKRPSIAELAQRAPDPKQQRLDPKIVEQLKTHELVKAVLDTLGGEIIKVE